MTSRFARRITFVAGLFTLSACSPFYVLRAGYEEAKILLRRESIAELVRDPETEPATRGKLELVLDARRFAAERLRLDAGDSYTTYSALDSDTLAFILSAAHPDRFEAYTWWFPIVGHVPYKGYFSERSARAAERSLREKGFDTYVRPTAAFSTLGWFNDPLVSPLLRYDSVSLAGTVIHEILHNTIYISGETAFNESFAEFVGGRGAIEFFCGGDGGGSSSCARARAAWADELVFGEFLSGLVAELEALYARDELRADQTLALRGAIFERARERFRTEVQPRLRALSYARFLEQPLNNATLISQRLYYRRLDLFDDLYVQTGSDLARAIRLIASVAEDAEDPYAAVEALLAVQPGGG